MTPDLSVIVPTYNDADRIDVLLDRLTRQTYPADRYEVIIVDNGSTDSSPQEIAERVQSWPGQVRCEFETRIQSSYAARNRGVACARGSVFAFTDADCVPALNWLEKGIHALRQNRVRCGGGRIQLFFQDQKPNVYEYFDSVRKLNQQDYVERAGFAATANFFALREVFTQYGNFRHDLISGGDYEFGRRLTEAGERLLYIPDAVVHHPARTSFQEIWRKSKRVAEGQRKLEELGLLHHGQVTWHRMLPAFTGIKARDLKILQRFHYMLLANTIRYTNLWVRKGWQATPPTV